jgi:cephalosporin-C deacetylase-like acetyl esterase
MKKMMLFLAAVLAVAASAVEYKFELKSDKGPVVKVGDEVTFFGRPLSRENAKAPFTPLKGVKLSVRLAGDVAPAGKARTVEATGEFIPLKAKFTKPGWIYAKYELLDSNGKRLISAERRYGIYGGIGAIAEPEKLKQGKEEPADFDAFWKSRRAMLDKVPLNAKVTEYKGRVIKGFKVYDVQVDCAGGMPMSGFLTVPNNAKPKSLAAVVNYQGAGVSSSWVGAVNNALYMNINAHGIPNGKERSFYQNLGKTTLKSYYHQGKNDREKIYFHGMYLRVMRSLDYIKSRPEWNGKILIVSGSSQGGGQAIAAAALDPQVTLCVAAVPALSDHSGSFANRQPGWPQFYRGGSKADPKVVAATAYYDNVFFARRIKCETWLTTGLFDTTCSPASVYMVYNNLAAKKKDIDIFPFGSHSGAPSRKGQARQKEVIAGK